jgi:hypothetical protein
MKNEIILNSAELLEIQPTKADQIKQTFEPMVEMLSEFDSEYKKIIKRSKTAITDELAVNAKTLRLAITKIETATEKNRKEQKSEYLRAGKAIDSVSNILKWAIGDMKTELKGIETHYETIENERIKTLQNERVELIEPYIDDAVERELWRMEPDVWDVFLEKKIFEHKEIIEAAKIAEQKRIENEAIEAKAAELKRYNAQKEQMRVNAENKRIKAENEALKVENERIQKEQIKIFNSATSSKPIFPEVPPNAAWGSVEVAVPTPYDERILPDSVSKKRLIQDLSDIKGKYKFNDPETYELQNDVDGLLDKVINFIKTY